MGHNVKQEMDVGWNDLTLVELIDRRVELSLPKSHKGTMWEGHFVVCFSV